MAGIATSPVPVRLVQRTLANRNDESVSALPWTYVVTHSLLPLCLLLLRIGPQPYNAASYPLLALYSLFGRRHAILSLFLLYLFNTWTHDFGAPPRLASLFRHFNILVAAASVLLIHLGRPPRSTMPVFLWWTAGLSGMLLAHSALLSTMPSISILKAISFGLTIQTLLVAWSSLSRADRQLLETQIFAFLTLAAVFSVPLIGRPEGYLRHSRFFKGILVHSQTFGPTMAYLATWSIISWLSQRGWRLLVFGTFCLGSTMVYLSKSRIALVVFLAGLMAAMIFGPIVRGVTRYRTDHPIRKGRLVLLAGVMLIAASFLGPRLYKRVDEFLRKEHHTETLAEAVVKSREFAIEAMMHNIRQRPLTGIGFGVPSNPDTDDWYGYTRDPFFGLPIMAPVEKGVMPIAMVEEMGGVLSVLYFAWIGALLWMASRAGVAAAALCAAGFATSLAEATFFAPGGAGMMTLVLVTMAATTPTLAASYRPRAQPAPHDRWPESLPVTT